jgi:hypothetical protein
MKSSKCKRLCALIRIKNAQLIYNVISFYTLLLSLGPNGRQKDILALCAPSVLKPSKISQEIVK